MNQTKLWTRNFRLVILASALGTVGAIAGGFALSFLVFDETGSTLASALIVAIQLLPYLLLPVLVAPIMDRLPRKAFLVGGDVANAVLLAGMGLWLLFFRFSYVGYLAVSLLLACLGAVDELAFTSIYPELIPQGAEQKGYAVSSMLYPVLKVIMTPLAAVLLDTLGVAWILIAQYRIKIPDKKKHGFVFFVYQVYETMDMCLLWLPYPQMLVNRGICGFLGSNSAILRSAAVQRYIPSKLRARVNAFDSVLITAGASVFSLLIGFLGEILDYRWCVTVGGAIAMLASWLLIWGRRKDVRKVYEAGSEDCLR